MILTLKKVGIGLILLGILLLTAEYVFNFTMVNILLIVPLLFIILGIVAYVYGQKRESRY